MFHWKSLFVESLGGYNNTRKVLSNVYKEHLYLANAHEEETASHWTNKTNKGEKIGYLLISNYNYINAANRKTKFPKCGRAMDIRNPSMGNKYTSGGPKSRIVDSVWKIWKRRARIPIGRPVVPNQTKRTHLKYDQCVCHYYSTRESAILFRGVLWYFL